MTDIKELATLTAAEMDNIYLRNVPAIILEQYAARLIAAYLKEQKPVVRVVDGGGELHLPKLQWVSANVSLETPIGSDLFLAPPLPAIPDGCVVVGYLDGRGRFFYADDPHMEIDHTGMREVFAAGEVKP